MCNIPRGVCFRKIINWRRNCLINGNIHILCMYHYIHNNIGMHICYVSQTPVHINCPTSSIHRSVVYKLRCANLHYLSLLYCYCSKFIFSQICLIINMCVFMYMYVCVHVCWKYDLDHAWMTIYWHIDNFTGQKWKRIYSKNVTLTLFDLLFADTMIKQNLNSLVFLRDTCSMRLKHLQDGGTDSEIEVSSECLLQLFSL